MDLIKDTQNNNMIVITIIAISATSSTGKGYTDNNVKYTHVRFLSLPAAAHNIMSLKLCCA